MLLTRMSGRDELKTYVMMLLGITLSTIGISSLTGYVRFTFGSATLIQGLDYIPIIMGLFGIAEVLSSAEETNIVKEIFGVKFRELWPSKQDMKDSAGPIARASVVGF